MDTGEKVMTLSLMTITGLTIALESDQTEEIQ